MMMAVSYRVCRHQAAQPTEALNIPNAVADSSSQLRRTHHDRKTLGSADRHVQPVGVEQKIEAARGAVSVTGGE